MEVLRRRHEVRWTVPNPSWFARRVHSSFGVFEKDGGSVIKYGGPITRSFGKWLLILALSVYEKDT